LSEKQNKRINIQKKQKTPYNFVCRRTKQTNIKKEIKEMDKTEFINNFVWKIAFFQGVRKVLLNEINKSCQSTT